MSTPTVERTGDWDSVPFTGGYAGLRDLADDEFSGMVTAGPARLFLLRGSVIGILDGDIEDFEDSAGTAREAPHPALPLLAVMQERSDEVRAQYYTEETAMSDVDRTLADGNFTGFIELSENVLSGDYYQVYHQGHSMSVAFVGASERLIVDDEAFEQADDEVGIYEVKPVDVEVIEIPEPAGDAGEPDDSPTPVATDTADASTDANIDASTDAEPTDDAPPATSTEDGPDDTGTAVDEPVDEEPVDASHPATDTDDGPIQEAEEPPAAADTDGERAGASASTDTAKTVETGEQADPTGDGSKAGGEETPDTSSQPSNAAATGASAGGAVENGSTGQQVPEESTGGATTSEPASRSTDDTASTPTGATESRPNSQARQGEPAPDHPAAGSQGDAGRQADASTGTSAEGSLAAGDLEVRSLPSLDPSRTASKSRQERERQSSETADGAATAQSEPAPETSASPEQNVAGQTAESTAQSPTQATQEPTATESAADTETGEPTAEGTDEPEQAEPASQPETTEDSTAGASSSASEDLEAAREEAERLEAELADLREDHDAVVDERDRLEEELADARAEIDRLQARLEDAAGQADAASRSLSPREAIDETNLFIRYDSKGEATLEKAHAGEVDKESVDANLRLEYHTSFDAGDAAVDGIGFDSFLTDTVQYRFVDWLVRKLLYEIRDTGNTGPMAELYDALPKVDRAELNGQVSVQYSEDGSEHRSQIGFDVIVRDRMGNPLIVANLNDSRDPATDSMMTDLVRAAERVGESSPSLAGAFLVTRSFFAPEALETAEEATAGGLLNRGKQKSFVNLSRKGGYHLCLVEARNQEFHLAVPEL